jgi:hypothetical protein
VEIITTGLQITIANYTLIILTVMEEYFETEVSTAANFFKLVIHNYKIVLSARVLK